jgi:hypothetical protein
VRAVEGQVTDERGLTFAEQPDGFALALAGSEVPGGKTQVAELHRFLVRHHPVRERRTRRPLVAEHPPPLGALGLVLLADLAFDVAMRDHRDVLARE